MNKPSNFISAHCAYNISHRDNEFIIMTNVMNAIKRSANLGKTSIEVQLTNGVVDQLKAAGYIVEKGYFPHKGKKVNCTIGWWNKPNAPATAN